MDDQPQITLGINTSHFSVAFTDYWLRRWGVFVWDNGPTIQNQQVWEDTAIVADKGRPGDGYPVFTVRTLAVNALGIPSVFFLGAILQCNLSAAE